MEKSRVDTVTCGKASYDKDLESGSKSTARSKASYDKDPEKSRVDTAAHTKSSYDKDPESSAKSTARSKAYYDKDLEIAILTVLHTLGIIMKRILRQAALLKGKGMCSFVCVHYL